MGSHSVTFHPTQANTPRLYPSQTGWYCDVGAEINLFTHFPAVGLINVAYCSAKLTQPMNALFYFCGFAA